MAVLTLATRGWRGEASEAGRHAWCRAVVQGMQSGGEARHGEVLEAVCGRVSLRYDGVCVQAE
jgi:hypothetical protein